MKVVNIIGGLGNQLFQYAFALALQKEFPKDQIKINILCFRGYHLHNGFELEQIFDINLPKATILDLCEVAYPWGHYRLWQYLHKLLPTRNTMVFSYQLKDFKWEELKDKQYFDGYWQSEKFFSKHKETIRHSLQFPIIKDEKNLKALEYITNNETAFIHIRRGDYINHPLFGNICTLNYYKTAINKLKKIYDYKNFIVFSNDITWCKKELSEEFSDSNVMYVDWNKGIDSYIDIQLMSKCSGGIIANSSFSWWGAWLSNSKIIIAPSQWTTNPNILNDIVPDNWIKI